jgi:NMT1/THI5 like
VGRGGARAFQEIWYRAGTDLPGRRFENRAGAHESESIQLGRFNVASAVDARLAGGTLVAIGSFYDYYYFQIFGKPVLQRPTDLRGKVIAASSAGSASEYGMREALGHFGLKDSEYKILYTGGTDARVQALQQGLADAAIIFPPNGLIAQKLGFKESVNLMEMKMLFGYGGLVGKENWLRQIARRRGFSKSAIRRSVSGATPG